MYNYDYDALDIPNLTENNIHYGSRSFKYTANLQATSIVLILSIHMNYRCGWIERLHSSSFQIQFSTRRYAIQGEVFRSSQPIHS